MSGTTFCNSAGVHAIITAHRQITKTHTQFRLVATAVLRIFKLVGADQLTPTYPTLERHSPDRLAHWPASVINATNPAQLSRGLLAGSDDLLDPLMEDPPAALVFMGEHRACC